MASEPAAGVRRDGDTLVLNGVLDRAAATALWPQAQAQAAGIARIDLAAVPRVDSAGLALLAELCARAGHAVAVEHAPAELAELRAAYRMGPGLDFQAASVKESP
ncbi:STAS domain-containing protein [Xanthomonas massiliensis]|jgi:phospholipid transport system transporter-binding protein|uniref:STAS domain-containing protein n=1 Tax=Xanthomonas massiliensis TaxID=1720302 RepID=UPI0008249322|nr:STAS domain-containing protein [Xanthomonas massiliensis]